MTWYKLVDRKPVPATHDDYQEIFDEESRRVGCTGLPCGGKVSTVFLGLDHNFGGEGGPILFESMAFLPDRDIEDCQRYRTWEEAEQGHRQMVIKYGGVTECLDEDLFNV